jgi:hypothetical protein
LIKFFVINLLQGTGLGYIGNWLKDVGSIQETIQKEASKVSKLDVRKLRNNFARNLLREVNSEMLCS